MSPCFTCCPATVLPSTCPETTKPLSHSTPAAVGRSRTAQTNTGKSQRVGKSESEARGRHGAAVGARVDTERKRTSRACGGRGSSRCRPSSQGMAHGMNSDMKIGARRAAAARAPPNNPISPRIFFILHSCFCLWGPPGRFTPRVPTPLFHDCS